VLVTDGTLNVKDQILCGESFARVRGLIDDHGTNLKEAGPATPVTLLGLDALPMPGDKLFVVRTSRRRRRSSRSAAPHARLSRAERSRSRPRTCRRSLAERTVEEIKIILKADAMGSLEPIRKCLGS
jgi:translation initiation factor IF-2